MNTLRLSAFSLITMMLIPMGAAAHCKGKHTGSHEHCVTGTNEYEANNDGVVFQTPSGIPGFDYYIKGTDDRDDIRAGRFRDYIDGFGTRDEIYALGNDDEIHGGDGSDIIDGGEGNDIVYGDAGGDWLRGGAGTGHDELYGGADDDALNFSLGLDRYDGGPGFDLIQFEDANSVTVDLAALSYTAKINDPSTGLETTEEWTFMDIEGVWGSPGDDIIYGAVVGNDTLYGGEGNDWIDARDGDDDNIDGGPGDDVIYGGSGNDNLHGDGGNDRMFGEEGDDVISSRGDQANDEMEGGAGCDTFWFKGRFGEDTIIDFEEGCDRIDLSAFNPKFHVDFNDLEISNSGSDISIFFWVRKQGGAGGTIVLRDGVGNVSVDSSDFIF